MDNTDQQLISLLQINARESTSELARKLSLSRSTVQDRIKRLESNGLIAAYTIRLNPEHEQQQITAHVMISITPKLADNITRKLKQMHTLKALHSVSGLYDLIAILVAPSTQSIDQYLDDIGRIEGVEKTTSSIVLSTKFQR